ncbi:MAG: glycosyltransferase family protein [Gemmatimonadaceae bacterium]|nr:glycosyltransferase family protein [Gemmatimonadaceae bacterium]
MTRTRRLPMRPPHRSVLASSQYGRLVAEADALRRRGAYDEAVRAFHALTLQYPDRSETFSNLAGILQASGHPTLALQAATRALELAPHSVPALRNSAEILKDFGEWDVVLDTYDAALAIDPASAELQFARGLHLLMLGRWQEGWAAHEARLAVPELNLGLRRFASPRWDGAPLDGRHILLDGEQGLGDQVMFARFATQVAARGGRVTLRCAAPLTTLLSAVPGVSAVIATDAPVPAHDVHASLMSLPCLLGVRSPADVSGTPWLTPVGACPEPIAQALPVAAPRVGLVWSGNPQHRNDARRSIRSELLAPLTAVAGVHWIALQRHDAHTPLPEPLQGRLTDLGGMLHTMNDTAHALTRLDLLVTVDTAVAHLAGALGVRTLLLVPFVPDWRWMVDRPDTPWYDSVTLVRQAALFEWSAPLDAVRQQVTMLRGTSA